MPTTAVSNVCVKGWQHLTFAPWGKSPGNTHGSQETCSLNPLSHRSGGWETHEAPRCLGLRCLRTGGSGCRTVLSARALCPLHAPAHHVKIRSAQNRPAMSSHRCSEATRWQEGFTFTSVPHPYCKDYQEKKKASLKLVLKLCFQTQAIHIITISFEPTRLLKMRKVDWLLL